MLESATFGPDQAPGKTLPLKCASNPLIKSSGFVQAAPMQTDFGPERPDTVMEKFSEYLPSNSSVRRNESQSTKALFKPEDLLKVIRRLEDEKLLCKAEEKLSKMVLTNAEAIHQTITTFFTQLICEIHQLGFDLKNVKLMREVLSDTHLKSLEKQIEESENMQVFLGQPIPSLKVLHDFRDLLIYLRTCPPQKQADQKHVEKSKGFKMRELKTREHQASIQAVKKPKEHEFKNRLREASLKTVRVTRDETDEKQAGFKIAGLPKLSVK